MLKKWKPLLLSLALGSGAAYAQQAEWTMITPLTPAIDYVSIYQDMIERIEERTDGDVKITLLTYGQHPFKDIDMVNAVKDNIVQIGNFADGYISSVEPSVLIMGMPFIFDDLEHAKTTFADLQEGLYAELFDEKFNSQPLTGFIVSGSAIHADVPLTDENSLKGRKIRVFGKESGEMIELLGGSPSTVSFGELYTALQRGTIDGALTGMIGAKAAKIYEVVDHNTWWNWSFPAEFTIVNNDALAALTDEQRAIVLEEGERASAELQALQDALPPQILAEALEEYGISAHGLSDSTRAKFREKTRPVVDDWLERSGDYGQRAYEIYENVSRN